MSSTTTTTEILFNSPALHSLKRDQLVKLCKIHSIKASGKNVELIARLKAVAETLPKESALRIAATSEGVEEVDNFDGDGDQKMEVAEIEGSSSRGTLVSHRSGEFGTTSSKSSMSTSTSVSSSIKALASSLGLKRSLTTKSTVSTVSSTSTLPPLPVFPKPSHYPVNDDLSKYAKPYSTIPESSPASMPKQDNFAPDNVPTAASLGKFDFSNTAEPEPLPGHVLRPGAPAPSNARLSLGLVPVTPGGKRKSGATTTIRLISGSTAGEDGIPSFFNPAGGPATPQLKPFKPSFDLVMGSPSAPGEFEKIYPALPMGDIIYNHPTTPSKDREKEQGQTQTAPGGLPTTTALSPEPKFIFGSPDPRKRPSVTNDDFRAAASSVLDEINKRLQGEGVDTIDSNIMGMFKPAKLNEDGSPRVVKPLPRPRGAVKDKFDRMHEKEFEKMESIGDFMHRKAALAAPIVSTEAPVATAVGRKRKSSVLGPDRADLQKAAIKKPKAKATIPGGFGDDDDDDEDEPVSGKKPRVEFAGDENEDDEKAREEEQERLRREREVVRRKLAMNREKRRSSGRVSVGRVSTGPRRSTLRLQKAPPKLAPTSKSRFGFGFVSTAAKTLVRGVWGGGSSKHPKEKEKDRAKPATEVAVSTTTTTSTSQSTSTAPASSRVLPKHQKKPSISGVNSAMRPSPMPAHGHQQKPSSSALNAGHGPGKRIASGTPSSIGTLNTTSSRASTADRSRSPIPATLRNGSDDRNSVVGASLRSIRGSITQSGSSATGSVAGSTRSRTSASTTNFLPTTVGSRLLAPTASSLAKTQGSVNRLRQVGPVPQNKPSGQSITSSFSNDQEKSRILDSITNTNNEAAVASKLAALPSTPGKIFSRPLAVPPGSGIPSPVRLNSTAMTSGPAPGPMRQKSLMGRKPRISRSKVIARLASQRVASGPSSSINPGTGATQSTAAGGTVRSSLGPRIGGAGPRKSTGVRRSAVGAGGRGIGIREARESAVMMSAKKRVRQSEYARRRSRISAAGPGGGQSMEVD
ncbi:hypothetical protein L218DRAFT_1072313 [Marasmius fiardii PR-910]|nr:hypothetical protein L218DRAFT_1072313 [Marasmius fiardii PR-910]